MVVISSTGRNLFLKSLALARDDGHRPVTFARACGLLEAVLVDGSFVTATPEPNDIDIVLVVAPSHDFSMDLPPEQYNLLAQRRVRMRFGFDIVVVKNDSENFKQAVSFFQQVKQRPDFKKGILRIKL